MKGRAARFPLLAAILSVALAAWPTGAHAHGAEGPAMQSEEEEVATLAEQPARTLAQQALAELLVRGDSHEAGVRLDAALESEDQSDIDVKLLRRATETLDGGDPEGAVPLLDEALSRPLGAASGKALHESGREFRPATGTQEVVAIIAGAVLLLLGGALLLRPHPRAPA